MAPTTRGALDRELAVRRQNEGDVVVVAKKARPKRRRGMTSDVVDLGGDGQHCFENLKGLGQRPSCDVGHLFPVLQRHLVATGQRKAVHRLIAVEHS